MPGRELCRQLGETPQLFPVLWGLQRFYLMRAEFLRARELGQQLLTLAQRVQDPALLLQAHYALGNTLSYFGEPAAARAHLEQALALYDRHEHRSHAFRYGQDPGAASLSYAGRVLWLLGYPEQALKASQEALILAQELSHPYSLAYVLYFATVLHQLRRESQATQARAEAVVAFSREQGFPLWIAGGTVLRGWALAEQGQRAEGMAQIWEGLAAWRATGAELGRPYYLGLLAEVHRETQQVEEGLRTLDEALALMYAHGERYYEAELYRLKGELLLAHSVEHDVEAGACFHQALDVARHQQAKLLELRAAMSLSRLWQQQGKRPEAYDLLAPIYGWFTEGFDTADLQEAKALLEALA